MQRGPRVRIATLGAALALETAGIFFLLGARTCGPNAGICGLSYAPADLFLGIVLVGGVVQLPHLARPEAAPLSVAGAALLLVAPYFGVLSVGPWVPAGTGILAFLPLVVIFLFPWLAAVLAVVGAGSSDPSTTRSSYTAWSLSGGSLMIVSSVALYIVPAGVTSGCRATGCGGVYAASVVGEVGASVFLLLFILAALSLFAAPHWRLGPIGLAGSAGFSIVLWLALFLRPSPVELEWPFLLVSVVFGFGGAAAGIIGAAMIWAHSAVHPETLNPGPVRGST